MNWLRNSSAVVALCLILFYFLVSPATAGIVDEPKNTYEILTAEEVKAQEGGTDSNQNNADSVDDKSNTGSNNNGVYGDGIGDGAIESDEIFSENKIAGMEVKKRNWWEPFSPVNWFKVLMVNDTLWGLFCLLFAVLGAGCFALSNLAFLKGGVTMGYAILTNNDPNESMATIDHEKDKAKKLVGGLGVVFGCMGLICFVMMMIT